jgi:hypothetical protein
MDGKAASAGEMLTQVMYDMTSAVRGLWNQVGQALAPVLTDLFKIAADYIGMASKWVAENHELIVTGAKIVAGVTAAGIALMAMGGIIAAAGSAFGVIASAVVTLGSALAFMVSPIGLVVAGITAGAYAFFQFTEVGQNALSSLMEAFDELTKDMRAAWGGIVDAIMAGDFELAGKIAFLGLQIEWAKVVERMKSIWRYVSTFFLDSWDVVSSGIASGMAVAVATVRSIWVQAIDFLRDAWDAGFVAMVQIASSALSAVMTPLRAAADLLADVTGIDIGAALSTFDKMQADAADKLTESTLQGIFQREQNRKKSLAGIEADKQDSLGNIAADRDRRIGGRAAANQSAADAGQAGIDALSKELMDAVGQAARVRDEADARKQRITDDGKKGVGTGAGGQSLNF